MPTVNICFVCLGNICRSPLAEGVLKNLVAQAGRSADFHIESAGLGAWHVGEAPDPRARQTAQAHSLQLTSYAQQFRAADFARFQWVLALDQSVATHLRRLASTEAHRQTIHLLRAYDPLANHDRDVPDPYSGSLHDFEVAYQMIERSCLHFFTVCS